MLFGTALSPVLRVYAAGKFETTITREFYLNEDLGVDVKETEVIYNNTSNLYIPAGSDQVFEILAIEEGVEANEEVLQRALDSARLTYNGSVLEFVPEIQESRVNLKTKFPSSLNPGESVRYEFEYTHYGMLEENGALKDFFLNGFAGSSEFSNETNLTTYNTKIFVPNTYKQTNFVLPEEYSKTEENGFDVYSFGQEDLIENYVWIQFGKTQFYRFRMTQRLNASERINTGNNNSYEIVLPRSVNEAKIIQTVYFSKIEPEPDWVKEDAEGNLLAGFLVPSNKSIDVVIEGYAKIARANDLPVDLGNLSQVDKESFDGYLGEAEYWEVSDPSILAQVSKFEKSDDIRTLVENTYNFVIDRIDYSEVKRFGINQRQGAVSTLNGGAAVCMEYSDLFLTLMRAQGVPARAAFGYGYDPKQPATAQEAHQWVEVYSPALGRWISVDVTWGETGDALIGGDMNHFYTHVAAINPNNPPVISGQGFGNLSLSNARYEIDVVSEIPEQSYRSQKELLEIYLYDERALSNSMVDNAKSKVNASVSNLLEGEPLAIDQVLILSLGGILFLFLVFGGGGLVVRYIRKYS